MFVDFCFTAFFGNLFFVLKFTVNTFIAVSPITKLGSGTASVLFPTLITFYKIYCVLELQLSGL